MRQSEQHLVNPHRDVRALSRSVALLARPLHHSLPPLVPVSEEPATAASAISSFTSPVWKRALDLTLLAGFAPLLAPLFLLISAWIKLTSKGPVFFRQERIGFGGAKFLFYKFRSMRVNVETASHESHVEDLVKSNQPMTKLDVLGDARLIPGGRLLRASGLDELPQVLNVLRGEMSFVGPRPCTTREYALYGDDQKLRFQVLPGLTGYWQVNGKNKTTFTGMIALDDHYVQHRSLPLDLLIMARTPGVLFSQLLASLFARTGGNSQKSGCKQADTYSESKT